MDEKKYEIIENFMDEDYYPDFYNNDATAIKQEVLSLGSIALLGEAFQPMIESFRAISKGEGASGQLYKAVFPDGVSGHLAKLKDRPGYTSTIVNSNGLAGQASMVPVDGASSGIAFDPVSIAVAVVLMNIEKKLDSIKDIQKDMLAFLEADKQAELKANLITLTDIMNNYKYNCKNAVYKQNKSILVQDIKKSAEQNLIFYHQEIERKMDKSVFFKMSGELDKRVTSIQTDFKYYHLALYLFAYSSFLEIMLIENFDQQFLKGISDLIDKKSLEYKVFFTECSEKIEKISNSSIENHLMGGVASLSKFAGETIAKIPKIRDGQIDENLIEVSNTIKTIQTQKHDQGVAKFAENKDSGIRGFSDNIKLINRMYNEPIEMVTNGNQIYLKCIG